MKSLLTAALLLLPHLLPAQIAIGGGAAEQLFDRHCAVCHGPAGRGGLGGTLIKNDWKHAPTDADRARVIRDGLPDFNKAGFDGILSDQEIRSLVIYLQEINQLAANRPAPPPAGRRGDTVFDTRHHRFRLETLTQSPSRFWGFDFFPDGRILLTEFDGALRILSPNGTLSDPVAGTPAVVRHGQGGLLDVAIHPDYPRQGWIYLTYTHGEGRNTMTRAVRGRIENHRWTDEQILFEAQPRHYRMSGVHFGSRIALRDGYLYFSIGDRGAQDQAQDLDRPNGKIFRLHDDGRIPADNPFADRGAYPQIWSYGHRNPQALAFRPGTAELWSTEHGPRGGDELNRIQPGLNYGWPVVTHGMNYNGTPITAETERDDMESPVWHWTPSIAVCGMAFVPPGVFPDWEGDLLVGGLRSEVVERLRLGPEGLLEREVILQGQGRVRDLGADANGNLCVILEGNGSRLVKLVPVP